MHPPPGSAHSSACNGRSDPSDATRSRGIGYAVTFISIVLLAGLTNEKKQRQILGALVDSKLHTMLLAPRRLVGAAAHNSPRVALPQWDSTRFPARNERVTHSGSQLALNGLGTLKYTHIAAEMPTANSKGLGGGGWLYPKSTYVEV